MSLAPEFIIQQMLVKGIRKFRENEDLTRMLFRNLDEREVNDVVKYLRNNSVEISINFPDTGLTFPAIIILLGSETESDAFLGELQQPAEAFRTDLPFPKEELLGDQTVLGAGSTGIAAGPSGSGRLLSPPMTALEGTVNTVTAPATMTNYIDPFEEDSFVVTMEGTGAGQRRQIDSIVPSLIGGGVLITVTDNWLTTPDDTTVFKIVGQRASIGATGEAAQLFDTSQWVERLGQIYQCNYKLDVVAYPQELVIYLYAIVKAIFIIMRGYLKGQGILTMQIGGTDFGPVPDYYPQNMFRRTMTLSFKQAFDVVAEIAQEVATSIELGIGVHDPDVQDEGDVEVEASLTSFDIT